MKHTRGLWQADRHHIGDGWRVFVKHKADADQHDAICDLETWQTKEETRANAALIASAPELLEACKMALNEIKSMAEALRNDHETCLSWEPLTNTILRATGGK